MGFKPEVFQESLSAGGPKVVEVVGPCDRTCCSSQKVTLTYMEALDNSGDAFKWLFNCFIDTPAETYT